jgi:2'-5' RNA ligase
LFLLIQEGNSSIIRLHDEIYTGLVADCWRKDLPFVPHLTLGVIGRDSRSRQHALEEALQMGIDARCVFDQLSLVKVNADRSAIVWSREFWLT